MQTLILSAEKTLSKNLGHSLHLDLANELKTDKNLVIRCQVANPSEGIPTSVIIKQLQRTDDKDKSVADALYWFLNEWSGLQFLTDLSDGFKFAPQLLACQRAQNLMVIEDLGDHPSLQDVLFDEDVPAQVGEKALLDMATYLGRMHSATLGRQAEFDAIKANLGGFTTPIEDASRDIRRNIPALRKFFAEVGIHISDGFYDELHQFEAAIHSPGPFRTYVHGDAAPHNFLYLNPGLKLIDFEFAQFNHALVEMVCLRMAFPSAYAGRHAPPSLVAQFEATYRSELVAKVPQAADDALFQAGIVQACAHWALTKFVPRLANYQEEIKAPGTIYKNHPDVTPEQVVYAIQSSITYFQAFIRAAQTFGYLPATQTGLQKIVDLLRRHWPDISPFPVYPIFQVKKEE